MAVYFLHVRDGLEVTRDQDGSTLGDLQAARKLAIESARQMMSEAVYHGNCIGLERTFEIEDDMGKLLLSVPFRDAIVFNEAE